MLVTGSSRGIGAAVAEGFAACGDRVAIHYHREERRAQSVLEALPGDGHCAVCGDLADPGETLALVDAAVDRLGGLDVLVNNAAVYLAQPPGAVSYDMWQSTWQQTLAVNLLGAANATWCALRHMDRGGRIVNIGSRGAFRGEPDHPAYAASKAGLVAFSQSMALALGPRGISVTAVAPGWVDTDMAAAALAGPAGESIRSQSPFGRVATAGEVAGAVLYLASPGAELASGAILDFNGASHLRL